MSLLDVAMGHVKIKSLRNKIISLREIMLKMSLDYFVISKTILGCSFTSEEFHINNYKASVKRDQK